MRAEAALLATTAVLATLTIASAQQLHRNNQPHLRQPPQA